jgi:hypothetical protein
MTDRVLRWLSSIALVLLLLFTALSLGTLPAYAARFELLQRWGTVYIVSFLLVPAAAGALCDVAGIATLVVTAQRKQWGWFAGMLICLAFHYFAGLTVDFPAGIIFRYMPIGGSLGLRALFTISSVVLLAPMLVLAFVYAWTRRAQPAVSTAG